MMLSRLAFLLPVAALAACGAATPDEDNEEEVITTVTLTFTPDGGGDAIEATWADPENDGSPVIDAITLGDGTTYALAVSFLNELEDPAEDITTEVAEEDDEHQVFVLGSAVEGPATGTNDDAVVTHAYDDADADGNPVGLANTITATGAGAGALRIVLRHLPAEDGTALKAAGLAEDLAADGLDALPGSTDADVSFDLTVE
jgi:hypothetical protein